jgi:hypothetical protein
MNRRDVLRAGVATAVIELSHRALIAGDEVSRVMTVQGPKVLPGPPTQPQPA